VIRLIDLLVVNRTDSGELEAMEITGLTDEEAREFGAKVGALIGFGAAGEGGAEAGAEVGAARGQAAAEDGMYSEDELLDVAEEIPPGTAAAIALIEHRWAIPLRDKIMQQGGLPLADAWIHPTDLIASGLAAKAQSDPTA
jgi:hypothetical protein